ncbi:EamA-like transporter family protein [Stieleria bergensis]|uniref:EamA-like transporter family protein n=1 Tax=Stieleria bergensis TaxID=2528025 RepID=A0A517T145_9BACT|nr:EamA-like transporter family protein [Planctomycetes bacterium SV_7m_r]
MSWVLLSLLSALLLGFYDAAKKVSVKQNVVPLVLLVSVSFGALLYTPLVIWSWLSIESIPWSSFRVQPMSSRWHGLVIAKSMLVGASWTFAFFALKRLPLSIAAPIRASSPFWTIAIATLLMGERPSGLQWTGMAIVMFGFWRFTLVGREEGIHFHRDFGVGLMIVATLLGALSSIYDKWLLQIEQIPPVALQSWFSIYLVPVMVPAALWWYRSWRVAGRAIEQVAGKTPTDKALGPEPSASDGASSVPSDSPSKFSPSGFQWRWSILLISPLLITADWFYFVALANPTAMVSVVSVLRRCSVVIALAFGARALSEANYWAKARCVGIFLLGVAVIALPDVLGESSQ